MSLDWTQLNKLPPEKRFRDYGDFGLGIMKPLVSFCHRWKIRPDVIWLFASFSLLVSGFFFLCYDLFLGFFFLLGKVGITHLGNLVARMSSPPTAAGFYLHRILEFVGVTFVLYCLSQNAFDFLPGLFFILLAVSVFLQTSYYEYYEAHYLNALDIHVRPFAEEDINHVNSPKWMHYLRKAEEICYTWQARAIRRLDLWMRGGGEIPAGWYTNTRLLSHQTAFRRGLQLSAIAVLSALLNVHWACGGYLLGSNLYWGWLIRSRRANAHHAPPSPHATENA